MTTPQGSSSPSREELERHARLSALFASMVLHQTNLTLMLLGQMPHPEGAKVDVDVDGAQLLIDQLEMLEAKTQGNLDEQESQLLRNSLMTLRMAFVQAVDAKAASRPTASAANAAQATAPTPSAPEAQGTAPKADQGS